MSHKSLRRTFMPLLPIVPIFIMALALNACDTSYTELDGETYGGSMSSEGFLWASSSSSSSVSSSRSNVGSGCQIGGCSMQLCANEGEQVMSTCEWRESYACYKAATCEKQADGNCGWTTSAELSTCLATADQSPPTGDDGSEDR